MGKKRGQAALEFLITYGWALIIILVVIAAIAYIGDLNPKKIIPDRCVFSPEIECVAYALSSADNTLKLKLKNNLGGMITVTSFELSSEGSTSISCTNPSNPTNWKVEDTIDLTFSNCNLEAMGFTKGETAKLSVTINFYPFKGGSSYRRSVQGELITKVS